MSTVTVTTIDEREQLRRTRDDVAELERTIPGRYFLSETQRAAYGVVKRHLEFWAAYEGVDE